MKQAYAALKSPITSKCLGNCRLSYEQAFWCWIIKIHITIYTKYTWQGYSKPNVTDQSIFYTLNNLYNKQNTINLNIRKALESKFMFFYNKQLKNNVKTCIFDSAKWQKGGLLDWPTIRFCWRQQFHLIDTRAFLDNL